MLTIQTYVIHFKKVVSLHPVVTFQELILQIYQRQYASRDLYLNSTHKISNIITVRHAVIDEVELKMGKSKL